VRKVNDRQYVAKMPNVDNLEVWFQRASDVVRKMRAGDLDLGIVGFDMFEELGQARISPRTPCAPLGTALI
jgi:ATP phosphoribosyltransferase